MQFIRLSFRFSQEAKHSIIINKVVLQQLPSYIKTTQHLINSEHDLTQKYLIELHEEAQLTQNPIVIKEALSLQASYYEQQQDNVELLKTKEQLYFIQLSLNTIYNDANHALFKDIIQQYMVYDVKRGQAFMNFINEIMNDIPLVYQKECLIQGGTLEILMKNHNKASEYFQQALQMDLKDDNLGICLNNMVVNKLLLFNLEQNQTMDNYQKFIQQCFQEYIQSIIAFEIPSSSEQRPQLKQLYDLIEQTEQKINEKTINTTISTIDIQNEYTYKVIYNLIDLLLLMKQLDKAQAWIKLIFTIQSNREKLNKLPLQGFGRCIVQFSTILALQNNVQFSEKVLLDFLESNYPRISHSQLKGLTLYSQLLKDQQRIYEFEEYQKQALNISQQIDDKQYIRDQIII